MVSCGRCDRPICTKCMIPGPAGMRCKNCSSLRSSKLYRIHPVRLVLAGMGSLILGTVGSSCMADMGYWVIFAGPFFGGIVAEATLRLAGRKRGPMLEVIGVGGIVVGAIIVEGWVVSASGWALVATGRPVVSLGGVVMPLVGIGLALSTCYGRLKYL